MHWKYVVDFHTASMRNAINTHKNDQVRKRCDTCSCSYKMCVVCVSIYTINTEIKREKFTDR